MTRDPFLRLALVAVAAGCVVALFVVARYLGVAAAIAAALAGPALAGGASLTFERDVDEPDEDPRERQRQPREGTRGFERIR